VDLSHVSSFTTKYQFEFRSFGTFAYEAVSYVSSCIFRSFRKPVGENCGIKVILVVSTCVNGIIRLQLLHLVEMESRRVVVRLLRGDVRRRKSQPMSASIGLSPGVHSSYVPPSISPLLEPIPWDWFAEIDDYTSRSQICGAESDSKGTLLQM